VAPVVTTPFDKRLAEINGELTRSTLVYGKGESKDADDKKNRESLELAAPAQAARAAFQAKNAQAAAYDLLDNVKKGKVKLEEIKKDELPEELKKLTVKEQKEHLEKLDKKRDTLRKEALELDKKRSDFITQKQKDDAGKGKAGFDGQVLEILRKQAAKNKIEY